MNNATIEARNALVAAMAKMAENDAEQRNIVDELIMECTYLLQNGPVLCTCVKGDVKIADIRDFKGLLVEIRADRMVNKSTISLGNL